jgi:hypothetical protein
MRQVSTPIRAATRTTSQTAAYLALKQLWQLLPHTMTAESEYAMLGNESLELIIKHCGLYKGDYAGAQARRTMLLGLGALTVRKCADETVEFTKSDTFPEPDNPQDWVARENKRLQEGAERERAKMRREWAAHDAAQEKLNAPIVAAKRADFAFMLAEHGLSQDKLAATIEAAVEAAVERVMQAHGLLQTVSASTGSHER